MHCDPFLVVFPQRGYRIKPTAIKKIIYINFPIIYAIIYALNLRIKL